VSMTGERVIASASSVIRTREGRGVVIGKLERARRISERE